VIKSTCKTIAGFALCISVLAAIRAIVVVLQMRWIPRGYGLRQPYAAELIPLIIIIVLAIVVAIGVISLSTSIELETDFFHKKVRMAENEIEDMKKEINALRGKIDNLRKEPTP